MQHSMLGFRFLVCLSLGTQVEVCEFMLEVATRLQTVWLSTLQVALLFVYLAIGAAVAAYCGMLLDLFPFVSKRQSTRSYAMDSTWVAYGIRFLTGKVPVMKSKCALNAFALLPCCPPVQAAIVWRLTARFLIQCLLLRSLSF